MGAVEDLRRVMKNAGIDAYIMPGSDPHGSEYPPAYWDSREFISGFTGSAGTVVIWAEGAGLWTDSRYYLQAQHELSGISLYKQGEPGVPEIHEELVKILPKGSMVAMSEDECMYSQFTFFKNYFQKNELNFKTSNDLLGEIWTDRPPLPSRTIESRGLGNLRREKIKTLRDLMHIQKAQGFFLSALDEIAWVLELRGSDVSYNPVFLSYLLIDEEESKLFLTESALSQIVKDELKADGIKIFPYETVYEHLKSIDNKKHVLCNFDQTSVHCFASMKAACENSGQSIALLKSRKTPAELEGFRKAMVQDGVAMVKFWIWFEEEGLGKTEAALGHELKKFREEREDFVGESFHPILGFNENGAIIHYRADEENSKTIEATGVLLVDSGGQYKSGTTDITRIFLKGNASKELKADATNVLKGHIALSKVQFPQGTKGHHIDVLARQFLWESGKNYGHGTGHGVGCFLNVHEGPGRISPKTNEIVLEPGMVFSNEPGYYLEGKYGIRIENLLAVQEHREFKGFLSFETLTLCPYDANLIEPGMLSAEEKKWVNEYHSQVLKQLKSYLTEKELRWLEEKTAAL
jgi:Xaa-Pro aminopeptidase